MRKIIHIDCDCFYAACEMREKPHLRKVPLAVSGSSKRSVLSTCNYEARRWGLRSGMPLFMALEKCPILVTVPHRFDVYKEESKKIREIFRRYTDCIEPLSLDEAFLDVSDHPLHPKQIAELILSAIRKERRLPASAGIAPNKLLAKIASDWNKPQGLFEIKPNEVDAFIEALPVRKLWGVGPKMETTLARLGIRTCKDFQEYPLKEILDRFGKWGLELYHLAHGRDNRPVKPERIRKSCSTEHTYLDPITTLEEAEEKLTELFQEFAEDLARYPAESLHTPFIKITFADFSKTTVSKTHLEPTYTHYRSLLAEGFGRSDLPIRLLGIGIRFKTEDAAWTQLEFGLPEDPPHPFSGDGGKRDRSQIKT